MTRELGRTLVPLWVLAALLLLVIAWGTGPGTTALVVLSGTAALTLGLLLFARRRLARLTALEHYTQHLLTERIDPEDDRPHPPVGDGSVMGEFTPLAASLDELGGRQNSRLKELAKKSRNLEALIYALDEPLIATDDEQNVLLCNPSAEKLFDAKPGGLIGRPIETLFTQPEILDMHAAARGGEIRRLRVKVITAYGARVFQVSATPVPVAWGQGVFGAVLFLRDVTELDQAVQVKTDFVANASHELRTPVSAIRIAAETIESGVDDPATLKKFLGKIQNNAERLEEMIRDLLDLSRLESHELQIATVPVDLRVMAETLRGMFADVCRGRRLTLEFDIDPALSRLRSDPKLLGLILRNLIENATKFAYEGTAVRVSAVASDVGTEHIPVAAGVDPGTELFPVTSTRVTARFEVSDQGIGVPLQMRERVFERYFQVDQARSGGAGGPGGLTPRGSGLGLSIVKHAVKALGGEVGLESVWKQGTRVWFEIPAIVDAATAPAASDAG